MGINKREDLSDQERYDIQMDELEKWLSNIDKANSGRNPTFHEIDACLTLSKTVIEGIRKNFKVEQNDGN